LYAVVAFFLYGAVQLADRSLFLFSPYYPKFLVHRDLGDVSWLDLKMLRDGDCKLGPIEMQRKKGYVLLRCGSSGSLNRLMFTARSIRECRPAAPCGEE
jgi:hypothetical protein